MTSGMRRLNLSMKVSNVLSHITIYKIGCESKVRIKTASIKLENAQMSEYAINQETGELQLITGTAMPEDALPELTRIINQYFGRSWSRTDLNKNNLKKK